MKPNIVCVSLLQKSFPQTSKCPKNQWQTVRGRPKKIHAIPFNSMQYNAISLHWQSTVPVCKAVIFTDKVALINCSQESREIFSCGRCPDVQTSSYTIVRSNTSLTKTKGTFKVHICVPEIDETQANPRFSCAFRNEKGVHCTDWTVPIVSTPCNCWKCAQIITYFKLDGN